VLPAIIPAVPVRLHKTVGVKVGDVQVGGGAPVLELRGRSPALVS